MEIEIQPADRILFLGLPEEVTLRGLAARLSAGVVVAMGEADDVRAARVRFRDLPNVMFVPGAPDEIPWQDGYFDRVVDLRNGDWPDAERVTRECERVTRIR